MGAVSSLTNFSVPLSGTGESASSQGLIFPKLKLRFRLLFIGFGVNTNTSYITRQVSDFKRPSLTFGDKVIDVYNSKIHYAGKPTWAASSCTIKDDMQGNVQSLVGQQLQKQFDFMNQASAVAPSDYKFELLAQTLDGGNGTAEPVVLETWDLVGCYLNSADYDTFDYAGDDPLTVKLTITFDNAIQTDFGVGMPVPRTDTVFAI